MEKWGRAEGVWLERMRFDVGDGARGSGAARWCAVVAPAAAAAVVVHLENVGNWMSSLPSHLLVFPFLPTRLHEPVPAYTSSPDRPSGQVIDMVAGGGGKEVLLPRRALVALL